MGRDNTTASNTLTTATLPLAAATTLPLAAATTLPLAAATTLPLAAPPPFLEKSVTVQGVIQNNRYPSYRPLRKRILQTRTAVFRSKKRKNSFPHPSIGPIAIY